METLLTVLAGGIAGAIPGIIAWLLNRKKDKAETADTLVDISMKLIAPLEKKIKDLENKVILLENENKELRSDINRLVTRIRKYEPDFTLHKEL